MVGFGPVLTNSNGSTSGSMHKFWYLETKKIWFKFWKSWLVLVQFLLIQSWTSELTPGSKSLFSSKNKSQVLILGPVSHPKKVRNPVPSMVLTHVLALEISLVSSLVRINWNWNQGLLPTKVGNLSTLVWTLNLSDLLFCLLTQFFILFFVVALVFSFPSFSSSSLIFFFYFSFISSPPAAVLLI